MKRLLGRSVLAALAGVSVLGCSGNETPPIAPVTNASSGSSSQQASAAPSSAPSKSAESDEKPSESEKKEEGGASSAPPSSGGGGGPMGGMSSARNMPGSPYASGGGGGGPPGASPYGSGNGPPGMTGGSPYGGGGSPYGSSGPPGGAASGMAGMDMKGFLGGNRGAGAPTGSPTGAPGEGFESPSSSSSTSQTVQAREMTFRERAEDYFAKGQEKEAFALIQAHLLASDAESKDYLDRIRWSPLRKQPTLGARIAIGIDLKGPKVSDYSPIRASEVGDRAGSGGEMMGGMGGLGGIRRPGSSANNAPTEEPTLEEVTGDMGKLLQDHVREIFDAGQLGTCFLGTTDLVSTETGASGAAGGMNSRFSGGGGPGAGYPGAGGPPGGGGRPAGYPGAGGGGPPSGYPGGGAMGGMAEGAGDASGSPSAPSPQPGFGGGFAGSFGGQGQQVGELLTGKRGTPNKNRLVPGLTFIGIDSAADLQEKALDEGYDLLVIFDVTIEQSRRLSNVSNDCRAKLFKPGEKKALISSESLNNIKAKKELEKDGDYVAKAMRRVFDKIDESISLSDIPEKVNAEAIKKSRLATLTDGSKPKLEALCELKLWHHRQYLSDDDLKAAFTKVLSADEATKLISGTEEDRMDVLKPLAP